MNDKARFGNRNPDPVISLNRQFDKLMRGRPFTGVKDKPVNGWVQLGDENAPSFSNRKYLLKPNRYQRGDRIYQMQVDYCYYIKEVIDTNGRNTGLIKNCQEFINTCRAELV